MRIWWCAEAELADPQLDAESCMGLYHVADSYDAPRPENPECGWRLLLSLNEQGAHPFNLHVVDTVEGAIRDVVGYDWPTTNLGTVALRALMDEIRANSENALEAPQP